MRDEEQSIDELKSQVRQYQKILNNLHEGYLLVDTEGNIQDVNPAYCKMVGYSKEELITMRLTGVRPGMTLSYQKEFIEDVITNGSKEFETEHHTKTGKKVHLKASVASFTKGNKTYLASIVRDVTQRKKEQYSAEESRRRFKSLFKHNPHSVYYMDLEGNYLGVNSKMEELTGYSRKELLNLDFSPLIVDRDLEKTQQNFEKAARGEVCEYEISGITKQGKEKPVRVTNFPMIIKNEVVGVFGIAEDITERTKAEKKIKESRQRFKSLFEHNPHPVYYFNLDGSFKEVNEKLVEFTGYSRKKLLQLGFEHFVDEKDLEQTKTHFEKAASGTPGTYEISVRIKGDVKKDVLVTKFPIYINDEITGVYGILQDITDQKETARQLKQSQQKWQQLVKNSPLPVQVVVKGDILYINKAGADLYGAESPEELIGKSIYTFNAPEMQEVIKERIDRMNKGLPVEAYHNHKIITKNGIERFVEVHSVPINYQGEQAVQSVYHDITEQKTAEDKLKESEERWQKLVEDNPKPVQITIDAKIVFINEAGVDLYEAESREELIGKSVLKFTHPDALEEVKNRKAKLEEGMPVDQVFENKMVTMQGKVRIIDVHSIPITYKGEQAIQTVIYDITGRKKEEELIQSSLKEKQILLQEIHHRVKNNMAVVSGLLELQAMNTKNEGLKSILKESQMRIYSMAMIHEKLYASKSLSAINFNEYARELVEVIMSTVGDINTEVTVRFRMDEGELNINEAIPCGLILNELIVNCYKHAFKGQKTGSILVGFLLNEDKVNVTVEDNGAGLPEGFDIEKRQSLGMTIIQTLTRQLEGVINIESGKNSVGTCFSISFKKNN